MKEEVDFMIKQNHALTKFLEHTQRDNLDPSAFKTEILSRYEDND